MTDPTAVPDRSAPGPAATLVILDGLRFRTLSEFWDEVGRELAQAQACGRSLDAFDDLLGARARLPGPMHLRWLASERSRLALGAEATLLWLVRQLESCPRSQRRHRGQVLDDFRAGRGQHLFEQLVARIRDHDPARRRSAGGIILSLC